LRSPLQTLRRPKRLINSSCANSTNGNIDADIDDRAGVVECLNPFDDELAGL